MTIHRTLRAIAHAITLPLLLSACSESLPEPELTADPPPAAQKTPPPRSAPSVKRCPKKRCPRKKHPNPTPNPPGHATGHPSNRANQANSCPCTAMASTLPSAPTPPTTSNTSPGTAQTGCSSRAQTPHTPDSPATTKPKPNAKGSPNRSLIAWLRATSP